MAKLIITPMLGNPRADRLESLTHCHALHEKSEVAPLDVGRLGPTLEAAIKKILLTDDMRRNLRDNQKVSIILTLEL